MVEELWWVQFGVTNFYKGCGGMYECDKKVFLGHCFLGGKMDEVEKNKHDKNPFFKLNSNQ
jgi:hypothetical protein